MKKNSTILRLSLLTGTLYFFLMSVSHFLGLKIPGLFIYFDIPSYPYQDSIISSLALGWSLFFYTAFTNPVKNIDLVKTILIAGAAAIIILSLINIRTNFSLLNNSASIKIIWLEIALLFIYWLWLVVIYFRVKKSCS